MVKTCQCAGTPTCLRSNAHCDAATSCVQSGAVPATVASCHSQSSLRPPGQPNLENTYLLGLVVFSGMVLLDLPLLGRGRAPSITLLQRHIPSCVWMGFAIKMPLLPLKAWLMPRHGQRNPANWEVHVLSPPWVRAARLSLLMGCVSVACGRLIAYYYAFEF